MKPVYQTEHGPEGNCFEACLASLLDIELAELPDMSRDWAKRLRGWLAARDWDVEFIRGDGRPLADSQGPAGYAILAQRVLDGSVHAVVCRDGKIVHDPSPRPFSSDRFPAVLWTVLRKKRQ